MSRQYSVPGVEKPGSGNKEGVQDTMCMRSTWSHMATPGMIATADWEQSMCIGAQMP